ncbi:hypothetical protein Dimus_008073, partial [Dionaea muscipula]
EPSGIRLKHGDNSSSNSNNSNISSINNSSGDSGKVKAATGDLEADADSLTCRQSGLSSADPMERNGLIQPDVVIAEEEQDWNVLSVKE